VAGGGEEQVWWALMRRGHSQLLIGPAGSWLLVIVILFCVAILAGLWYRGQAAQTIVKTPAITPGSYRPAL